MPSSLVVVSPVDAASLQVDADGQPITSPADQALDALDDFNHPRLRRALILQALLQKKDICPMTFKVTGSLAEWTELYQSVHTTGLLDFLATAWTRWQALADGQDPSGGRTSTAGFVLVPSCMPLPRAPGQRPSQHVIGQMGYYCTEVGTPIYGALTAELAQDAAAVQAAVDAATSTPGQTSYVLPVHPGHHAAADSFGGYCYVNHVAAAARRLQNVHGHARVAVLDVDYHAGNGTASIFYQDPTVLVVSLHCDPDWDYPFHSGFADQRGEGEAVGTTLHLPLPPGTKWEAYQRALHRGLEAIRDFGASAVVVSLGLDTYDKDPCAIRRAGFHLQGSDYQDMGRCMAEEVTPGVPVVFLQEGGYRMEKIGEAAADVVTSFCLHRSVA